MGWPIQRGDLLVSRLRRLGGDTSRREPPRSLCGTLATLVAAVARSHPPRRGGAACHCCRRRSAATPPARAAQRSAEPAWHRRQRRQRGAARALLRVAASAALLRNHHSAQRPMGGRGGGAGGGKGSGGAGSNWGGDVAGVLQLLHQQNKQQQQLLQAMRGNNGMAGGSGGGYAQRRSGKGARRGDGPHPPAPGDWSCRECGFSPNFQRRRRCYECGAARPETAARAGSLSSGPVGANGLRPQLAWGPGRTGGADTAPTRRVPGASLAAAAQEASASATLAASATPQPGTTPPTGSAARSTMVYNACSGKSDAKATAWGPPHVAGGGDRGHAAQAGGKAAASTDAEGFQMVRRRGPKGGRESAATHWNGGGPAAATHQGGVRDGGDARGAPARAGERTLAGDEDGDDGGDEEEEEEWREEDPAALRRRLDQEEANVKLLARGGMHPQHPAMAAAVATRDNAAAAWRAARKPHPVGKRMGWAQQKYDRAFGALERARDELAEFDDRIKAQREKIIEKVARAREKVGRLREELEELQEEAGAEVSSTRKGRGGEVLCARLADGMRGTVAPNVAALAAQLDEGSEAHRQICLLMGHLQGLQSELEAHAGGGQEDIDHHQSFNIAEGDTRSEEDWQWSETDEHGDGHGTASEDDAMGHPMDSAAPMPTWKPEGHGRWGKDGPRTSTRGPQAGKGVGSADGPTNAQGDGAAAEGRRDAPATGAHAGTHGTAACVRAESEAARDGEHAHQAAAAASGSTTSTHYAGKGRDTPNDDDARPNKSRRGQASEDSVDAMAAVQNTVRAVELQQSQRAAAEAGSFGTEAAVQAAAQVHAREVARITAAAIDQGVQPVTGEGEDLIMLGPQALAQWAEAYLRTTA